MGKGGKREGEGEKGLKMERVRGRKRERDGEG